MSLDELLLLEKPGAAGGQGRGQRGSGGSGLAPQELVKHASANAPAPAT